MPPTGSAPATPRPARSSPKRADLQAALEQSEVFYSSLVESLPQNILRKDLQGRFTFANSRCCQTLGVPLEGIVGKTDFDLFPRELAAQYLADDQVVIESGQAQEGVEAHQTPDGLIYVRAIKAPVRDSAGRVVGIQCIFWDVTEQKRAQDELAVARDAALESARLKSEFLANMSHEIRTPLNAVIGMAGLLLDSPLNADQRDLATTVRTSADVLLSIVNDILDFSKIEAGKMTIENIDFDLTQVIEEAADLVAEQAQTKGLELVASIAEHLPPVVRGDPGRIRQILVNLLSNAVKFTARGEVVVAVDVVADSDLKQTLRWQVRDTGIGVPEEARLRLFTAFTQADGSTTRRYGGTGLGLAICRRLVELMGGEIGFDSVVGKGSTFWFTLPLDRHTGTLRPEIRGSLEGLHLLIVDDNETNRTILHRQTRSWRMRDACAGSGPEALAALRQAAAAGDPFALVVLDMQMPDMDGLEVARAIKADPALQATTIVMLTSLAHHHDDGTLQELGLAAYLTKPVKQSRLYDCLATLVGQRTARTPLASRTPTAEMPWRIAGGRPPRVLVAEDNPVNQKVALRLLQKLGISADAVSTGLEAITAIERARYDVILMDCQMPELDGYEATQRIRQREAAERSTRRHYIIALTAHALDGDREQCLQAGMDDYVSKPISLDSLVEALRRGTSPRKPTHAAEERDALPEPA